ncbi:MAG: hypothetical protein ACPGO3_02370 [Magnetospiraceae bacterium]
MGLRYRVWRIVEIPLYHLHDFAFQRCQKYSPATQPFSKAMADLRKDDPDFAAEVDDYRKRQRAVAGMNDIQARGETPDNATEETTG